MRVTTSTNTPTSDCQSGLLVSHLSCCSNSWTSVERMPRCKLLLHKSHQLKIRVCRGSAHDLPNPLVSHSVSQDSSRPSPAPSNSLCVYVLELPSFGVQAICVSHRGQHTLVTLHSDPLFLFPVKSIRFLVLFTVHITSMYTYIDSVRWATTIISMSSKQGHRGHV